MQTCVWFCSCLQIPWVSVGSNNSIVLARYPSAVSRSVGKTNNLGPRLKSQDSASVAGILNGSKKDYKDYILNGYKIGSLSVTIIHS